MMGILVGVTTGIAVHATHRNREEIFSDDNNSTIFLNREEIFSDDNNSTIFLNSTSRYETE